MMQTMRNSAKIVFFFVLIAFAGFMILQGLTSIFADPTRGGKAAPPGVIGTVDGIDIPLMVFENVYRPRLRALLQEDEETTEEQMEKIRDEIWNNLITITTLEIQARRHGIEITTAEVAEYMRISPPQDLLQLPEFQTDGYFDIQKYQVWLQQMASSNQPDLLRFISGFEDQIRQQLLINRLQEFITSMVRVTEAEVRDSFIEKNEKVKVKYILIPRSDFEDSIADIPESEILSKYEADKENYRSPEQVAVSYIQFVKSPGDEDLAIVRQRMDSLYNELMAGANFAEMAKEFSEDTGSGSKGGDLGWFGEGKMVQPFWEAASKLENISDISEPVKTQFGLHILKLTGKREVEPDDAADEPAMEYKASHILLKVFASPSTLAAIEEKANGFVQDAVVYGFEESAEDFEMDIIKTGPFSKSGFIPKLGSVPEISDFAFDAKAGDISDVILARNSLIVCQLDERIPLGYSPFEEVRDRVERTLLSQKQIEEAQKHAAGLRQNIEDGKSFEDMAASDGKQIEETDYFARYEFVPKIGSDPEFIGAAFSLSEDNPISRAVESRAGSYILKYVDRQAADTTLLAAQQDSLLQNTQDKERREIWSRWINSAKQNAEIEDYRSFYYGG